MDKVVWICVFCFFIQKTLSRNSQGHPNYLRGSYFNDINHLPSQSQESVHPLQPLPSLPQESVHPLQPHVNLQFHPVQHLSLIPKHLSKSLQPLPHSSQPSLHVGHSTSQTTQKITPFVHHLLQSSPELAQTVSPGTTPVQTLPPFGLMSPTLLPPQVPFHKNLDPHSNLIPNLQFKQDFNPNLQSKQVNNPNLQLQRELIQNLQPQNDLIPNLQLQGNLVSLLEPQRDQNIELKINSNLILQPIFRQSIPPPPVQLLKEHQFNLNNNNAIVTLSPLTRVGAIPQSVLPATPPYDVPETTPSYQVPAPTPTFAPEILTSFPITPKSPPSLSLDIDHIPFHPTTVFQAVPIPTPQSPEPAPEAINNFAPVFEENRSPQSPHLEIITSFKNTNNFPLVPNPAIGPPLDNIRPLLLKPHPTIEPALDIIHPSLPVSHPAIQSALPRKPEFLNIFSVPESHLLKVTQASPSNPLSLATPCTKKAECVNEYSPICEQKFLEKDGKECSIIHKQSCKPRTQITYELACFHPLEEVCRRREDCPGGECDVTCHKIQGKRSCKKIGVKTPVLDCVDVPEELCVNVKKKVPYEKCHDVAQKVCHQVDICV